MARRYVSDAGAEKLAGENRPWAYSTYSTACRTARVARAPGKRTYPTARRQDVADDPGDPGVAGLEGRPAFRRQANPAQRRRRRPRPGCRAISPRAFRVGGQAAAVSAMMLKGGMGGLLAGGAAGSVLSGGLGDLLDQFQQKGPRRHREFRLGQRRSQQTDLARRSRQCPWRRPDQFTGLAKRHVARRFAQRPQPVPARCDQPPDAGWAAALPNENELSRPGSDAAIARRMCAVSLHHCATEKGQQP